MSKKPRILLWDVETSLMDLHLESFTLKTPDYQSHKSIVNDWHMISIAWKELGKKQINAVSLLDDAKRFKTNPRDDRHIVETTANVLRNVDIIIGHNQAAFDVKKLNARLIYHKLPPIDMPLQVDTLKEARSIAKFTSNRLDYLAQHLGFEGKIESEGLWRTINKGNGDKDAIQAIKKMVRYNKQDVKILEYVYLALRPYMKKHVNLNIFNTESRLAGKQVAPVCGNCGSKDLVKNGVRPTLSGLKQKWSCKSCGHTTALTIKKEK